jgi:hypothetical protein
MRYGRSGCGGYTKSVCEVTGAGFEVRSLEENYRYPKYDSNLTEFYTAKFSGEE